MFGLIAGAEAGDWKKQRDKNWFIRKIRIRFIRIRIGIEAFKTCTKTAEDED